MKKNITINLLGRLYAIDEDAYELLKQYTDSLHSYFSRREGGEEIADDIEARIAELFEDLKAQGVLAITIEHVQDIIHRVGRPEEMDESPLLTSPIGEENTNGPEGNTNEPEESPSPSMGEAGKGAKRLYRNMSDRKLMGVLSGLAAYFGGDVLWWRLGFVALFFLPGGFVSRMFYWSPWHWGISINATLIILYIALGILMPVAETPEDRLRMKGKEVNPQNLADEVSQPQPTRRPDEGHMGCLGGFFFIMGTLIRWFIYFVGIVLAFTLLAGIVGLIAVMTMPHSMIHESDPTFWQFFDAHQSHLLIASVLSLGVLLIPTYCIIHSFFSEIKMLQPMGFRQRLSFLIVWIGLFIAAAVYCTGLVGKIKEAEDKSHEIRDEQYRKGNTHDGIFYKPDEWDFLSERGWRVVRADHCNDRYTSRGQYYTGRDARYIDTYDARHRQLFTIERTEDLQPGRYQLSACVRASGQGAYIYAFVDTLAENGAVYLAEIPADGNTGGGLWREAKQWLENERREHGDTIRNMELHDRMWNIAHANGEQGYGWNRITLPDILVKQPSLLHYGVSTVPSLTGHTWLGQWFSACDFELKRME
ncbi:MAG: PspC domain-containing protein [Bacteroidaceae bacterium]|nr:PspC domain-containing protein [Bacteroidaceae bacterium]